MRGSRCQATEDGGGGGIRRAGQRAARGSLVETGPHAGQQGTLEACGRAGGLPASLSDHENVDLDSLVLSSVLQCLKKPLRFRNCSRLTGRT